MSCRWWSRSCIFLLVVELAADGDDVATDGVADGVDADGVDADVCC